MVYKKKKKGSSLLITVAMFAILSILIMSVLAMTTSGYSLRIKNNKRIENFYAADSGLEISQKALHDYLGNAIKYALDETEKFILPDEKKPNHDEKKEKFNEEFKKFLVIGGSVINDRGGLEDFYGVEDYVKDPLRYDDFKRSGKEIIIAAELKSLKEDESEIAIPITSYNEIKKFLLKVISNFKDKENKEREVAVDFEIVIPQYEEVLIRVKNSKAPNILDYIVGVDGNYTLTTGNPTSILGDMWVKGKPVEDIPDSTNKYDGGITIKSDGAEEVMPNWNGKIATNETLRIENISLAIEAEPGKERDVFARNVVISNDEKKYGESITFGEDTNLHVYNDFLMEGTGNKVVLNNYYGLNDINDYEANWENKNLNNAQKSSSMLINALDFSIGSTINIANNLFILGTSYLELKGSDYQTGQGTIFNNISKPYTMRYDDYIYEYKSYTDGGIQIATKDKDGNEIPLDSYDEKNELRSSSKVDLAKKFYESSNALKSGITVPGEKIASPGVILANGEAVVKTPTIDQLEVAKEKQGLFAAEVFNMGSDKKYGQKDFWSNKVNESVKNSFNWSEINNIAVKDYSEDTKIQYIDGNKQDFIHLATKNSVVDIYEAAKEDENIFGDYPSITTSIPNEHANLILSNSDKKIILKSSGKAGTGTTNTPSKVSEIGNEIVYEIDIDGSDVSKASPLLVISKGDVVLQVEADAKFNYVMLISGGDAELKGNPTHIGNFSTSAIADSIGSRNMINEMFKYILESNKFLGSIGGNIFEGNEDKVTTNAIEISDLIRSKNWKLNK